MDAYCGIGTMSLALPAMRKKVYAMEIVDDAIVMAKEEQLNMRMRTLKRAAERKLCHAGRKEGIQPDVIVVGSTAQRLDLAFIEAACATGPERIVYVKAVTQQHSALATCPLQGT